MLRCCYQARSVGVVLCIFWLGQAWPVQSLPEICPPTATLLPAAVAGNYSDYIAFKSTQHAASEGDSSSVVDRQWYTDYTKMSFSALLFYGYVFVLGMVLYFALRWFK